MGLVDELAKLDSLKKSGALSEAEFQQAKTKLLQSEGPVERPAEEERFSEEILHSNRYRESSDDDDQSLGKAANRYVSYQIVMGVIGLVLALIFFFGVFLPSFNQFHGSGNITITPSHNGVPLPPDWKR